MTSSLHYNWEALELPRDRLGLMILAATALHALVIFGVSFGINQEESKTPQVPSIEVTLVNSQSKNAPENAHYVAQANQEGGGNTDEKVRPETMFPSLLPKDSAELTSPNPPAMSPPSPSNPRVEVMTVAKAPHKWTSEVSPQKKVESKEVNAAQLISRSMDIASLEVEIGDSIRAYAEMPRRTFISATTREHKYAAYMDGWRRKVETLGNLHYPGEAQRQHLTGSLLMEVALNANGTIYSVEIKRSSGYKILDDYAIQVVRDASPYLPFPEAIRKDTDVLHITRTWKFLGDSNVVSQ
ncbi:MAG: TonB family protein [Gammaproteobacteria bacterium]|nr:TonB family protein [Gammaproteobacteria bacterium]